MDLIHPVDAHDVEEAIRSLAAEGRHARIVGGRRHMARAGRTEADVELWTTSLDRVVAYDPAEMLVVVEAGIRLGDLRATLTDGSQEWPSDEPDDATVGGVIAAGVDPVRRLRVGLMRDTVVEMEVVLGDGRHVTSGARTVKNVTGFDVHRLMTGSLGTIGVITQVALKVRPVPKAARTLVTAEGGLELGRRLLDALWEPAAVLAEPDRVAVRLEGWPAEVAEQDATVRSLASCEVTDEPITPGVELFPDAAVVAEIGVVPSALEAALAGRDAYRALMGVGVAWIPCLDAGMYEEVAGRVSTSFNCRSAEPISFGPPRGAIEERIRAACDPTGVFAL